MHPANVHPVLQRLVLHQQVKVLSPAPKPWRPFQLLTCLLQRTGRKNIPHEHCRALVHIYPTGLHAGSEWLGWAPVPQPANTPFLPFFPFFLVGCRQPDSAQSATRAPRSTQTPKCHGKGWALEAKSRLQKGCRRAAAEEQSPVPAGDRSGSSRCSADEAMQLLLPLIARVAACSVRTARGNCTISGDG